ncbi:MAG: hypothetical protein ACRDTV_20730 [Mycobacterium sp.]
MAVLTVRTAADLFSVALFLPDGLPWHRQSPRRSPYRSCDILLVILITRAAIKRNSQAGVHTGPGVEVIQQSVVKGIPVEQVTSVDREPGRRTFPAALGQSCEYGAFFAHNHPQLILPEVAGTHRPNDR